MPAGSSSTMLVFAFFFCCVGCCCKEVGVLQRFVVVVLSLCEPGKSVEVRKREKERERN